MDILKAGQRLKLARERKGLSYEQIFETTRIQPSILKGIEEGEAPVSPVFLKGFIKTYARSLGLDPEELFKGEEDKTKDHLKKEIKPSHEAKREKKPGYLKYFLFLMGFVIVAQGVRFLYFAKKGAPVEEAPLSPKEELAKEELKKDPAFETEKMVKEDRGETPVLKSEAGPEATNSVKKAGVLEGSHSALFYQIKQSAFKKELLIQSSEPLEIYFKTDKQASTVTKRLEPLIWFQIKAKNRIYLRFDKNRGEAHIFYNGQKVFTGNRDFFEKIF